MTFKKTEIDGVYMIAYDPRTDERGYFMRTFCSEEFSRAGIPFSVLQASRSMTKTKGTIRGLHFQNAPEAEQKVVQCIAGMIYDVVVDVRSSSPTYGTWIARTLGEKDTEALYVPKGCAHGFQALTDNAIVEYFMSEYYSSNHASGIRWDDPFFSIRWPVEHPVLSPQDAAWPLWK
jgi:dTDP-4-dehydrorhamnose 3,5-epimerase